jgi:hypothetical protein
MQPWDLGTEPHLRCLALAAPTLDDWRQSALECGGLPPLYFIASLLAMIVAMQIAGVEYKPTGSKLPEKQSGSPSADGPHSKGGEPSAEVAEGRPWTKENTPRNRVGKDPGFHLQNTI